SAEISGGGRISPSIMPPALASIRNEPLLGHLAGKSRAAPLLQRGSHVALRRVAGPRTRPAPGGDARVTEGKSAQHRRSVRVAPCRARVPIRSFGARSS